MLQGVRDDALISGLDLEPAEGVNDQGLALLPLGELRLAQALGPHSQVWLALQSDWQEHPVLRRTARELGRMDGLQQLEG